jgi:hypothetical protein
MSGLKTKITNVNVKSFIDSFADSDQKKEDSYVLLNLMQEVSGFEPKMWGPSMIGFGSYHYKSDRSRQEGDWFLIGFSPRKAAISLYVYTGCAEHIDLVEKLGKYTMGKACIYIKKLADIDQQALVNLMKATMTFLQNKYGQSS